MRRCSCVTISSCAVGARAPLDEQRRRLAQRDGAASDRRAGPRPRSARPARRRPRPCRSGSRAAARPSPAGPARDPRAARAAPRAGDRRRRPRPWASPCRSPASPAPRRARLLAPSRRRSANSSATPGAPISSASDAEHDREPHRNPARGRGSGGGGAGAGGGGGGGGLLAPAAASAASADSGRASRGGVVGCGRGVGNGITRLLDVDRARRAPSRRFLIRFLRSLRNGGGSLASSTSATSAFSATNSVPGAISSKPGDAPAGSAVGRVTRTSTYLSSACPGAICSSSGAMRRSMSSRTCASSSDGVHPVRAAAARRARSSPPARSRRQAAAHARQHHLSLCSRVIGLPLLMYRIAIQLLVDTNHHSPVFGTGTRVAPRRRPATAPPAACPRSPAPTAAAG